MRRLLRIFLIVIAVLMVIAWSVVGPIDRTPLESQPFYKEMMARLDTTKLHSYPSSAIHSAWTKVNITPPVGAPMAGYIKRDHYESVHDSLYARIIMLDNGGVKCALINVDLLLFPPALRDKLNSSLAGEKVFLYLSASHTHNGAGGWDDSMGGELVVGDYSQQWIDKMAADISSAIKGLQPQSSQLEYYEADANDLVENRVNVDSGKTDGYIRGFRIARADGKKAVLATYSAHATSIRKESLEISADYPGKLISLLEERYDFGMYMAGMVGSHRFVYNPTYDYEFIDIISPILKNRIDSAQFETLAPNALIRTSKIPVSFGPSQMRIGKDWKVRDWFFRMIFHRLQGELTVLEVGNVIMVGTPCDFSGEIYTIDGLGAYAVKNNKRLLITSFNGDYDGYITYDGHYGKSSKEEINALNWVGPYYGAYFSKMIRKVTDK